MSAESITVEVAYARPDKQLILSVTGPQGMTLLEATERSGIVEHFPEIDLATAKMGVFSKLEKPDSPLNNGDRVEIYRELIADPKQARKKKAGDAAAKRPAAKARPKAAATEGKAAEVASADAAGEASEEQAPPSSAD